MEYAPPTFSFTGLQFNPDIFENPLDDTVSGSVPDPLPINQLNTNNIQAKNPASNVNLYTDPITSTLTLGENTMPELKLRSLFNFSYADVFFIYNVLETVKNIFVMNVTGIFKQNIYADATLGYVSAGMEVTDNVGSTTDYDGNMSLKSRTLNLPNNVQALSSTSNVNLFTDPITSTLTLGENTIPELKLRSLYNFLYADIFYINNILETVKVYFVMFSTGLFQQDIYADTTTGLISAGITATNNAGSTTDYDGNMSLKSRTLTTGNTIRSNAPTNTLNLYTNQTGTFNLGNTAIVQFFIKASAVLLGNFGLSTAVSFAFNSLTSVGCSFYGDSANPSTQTANFNVFRSTTTPTVTNTGNCLFECDSMSLQATQLNTPNTIVSNTVASAVNLYTTNTGQINIGQTSGILQVPNTVRGSGTTGTINLFATHNEDIYLGTTSATLYTPNTMRAYVLGSAMNFFAGQTGQINFGGTGILQLTNSITSNLIANTLDLFTTQTGQINLGGATAGVIRLVNSIIANATGNIVNLFTTNTGDISIGGTGQVICNVSNHIIKGVGANLNISKRTQPSVGGITDTYFADGGRPTVASVILEADSNNSTTANDGSLKIYGRDVTQFNPAGTISKKTACAVGNIDDIYYVDTTRLTTASATITASSNGTATGNDGFLTLSARNIILGNPLLPQYVSSYNINTGTVRAGTIGLVVTATYAGVGGNLAQNTVYVTGTISVPTNGVYMFNLVQSFTMSVAGSTNRTVVDMLVRNNANVNQLSVGTVSVNGNQSINNHFMSTSGIYVFTSIVSGSPWNVQSRLETGTFGGTMQLNAGNYRFTSTRIA